MTNAEARFNKSLRPRKPEGSLGRTAQDVHLLNTQLLNYETLTRVYDYTIVTAKSNSTLFTLMQPPFTMSLC